MNVQQTSCAIWITLVNWKNWCVHMNNLWLKMLITLSTKHRLLICTCLNFLLCAKNLVVRQSAIANYCALGVTAKTLTKQTRLYCL